MLKLDVYNSNDVFNTIDKNYFPYYALYKDRLDGTDTILFNESDCCLPAGIAIIKPGENDDTLHISCFEVAKPIRHMGWGSKFLSALKNEVNGNYKYITLRSATPDLVNFYRKNGFNVYSHDGDIILMKCSI